MKQADAVETENCGLWCDSRQAFPLVNLAEG